MKKTISEMNGNELRSFLEIVSVVDRDGNTFDAFDNAHIGKDFYFADEKRLQIIKDTISFVFCGESEKTKYIKEILSHISSKNDEIALANELVNISTYSYLTDSISEWYQFPEDYKGIDAYVYAARLEFIANLHGGYADEIEIDALFAK